MYAIRSYYDSEGADDSLDGAGGGYHVAGHALGRRHLHRVGVVSEGGLDHAGLDRVVHRGAGAVGVIVGHLIRRDAGVLEGQRDGPGSARAGRLGRGDVVGVASYNFV